MLTIIVHGPRTALLLFNPGPPNGCTWVDCVSFRGRWIYFRGVLSIVHGRGSKSSILSRLIKLSCRVGFLLSVTTVLWRLCWLSLRVLPRRKRAVPAGELIASGRGGGSGGAEEACVRAGASVGAAML